MTDEVSGQLVVACFLVREGADITAKNGNDQTPLDACSPEMAVIVSTFADKYAGYSHMYLYMYMHTCIHMCSTTFPIELCVHEDV